MAEILYYTVEQIQEREFNNKLNNIRSQRDQLLKESDFFVMVDYPATQEEKNIVINYRQQLRDLPNKIINEEIDINNVIFPEKPDLLKA